MKARHPPLHRPVARLTLLADANYHRRRHRRYHRHYRGVSSQGDTEVNRPPFRHPPTFLPVCFCSVLVGCIYAHRIPLPASSLYCAPPLADSDMLFASWLGLVYPPMRECDYSSFAAQTIRWPGISPLVRSLIHTAETLFTIECLGIIRFTNGLVCGKRHPVQTQCSSSLRKECHQPITLHRLVPYPSNILTTCHSAQVLLLCQCGNAWIVLNYLDNKQALVGECTEHRSKDEGLRTSLVQWSLCIEALHQLE